VRRKDREMIPAQEFADYLNNRVAHWEQRLNGHYCLPSGEDAPAVRVARECGWVGETGMKRLYRFRHRLLESATGKNRHNKGIRTVTVTDWFPRDVVEDALHEAGVPFADVYPEIAAAEDVFLEPAKWCAGCREERTPINGVCPFCEWRLGPSTGQVLLGHKLSHGRRVAA
jgi:hypothetical protein